MKKVHAREDVWESALPTQRCKEKRTGDTSRRHPAPIAEESELWLQLAELSSGEVVLLHSCCAGVRVCTDVWWSFANRVCLLKSTREAHKSECGRRV